MIRMFSRAQWAVASWAGLVIVMPVLTIGCGNKTYQALDSIHAGQPMPDAAALVMPMEPGQTIGTFRCWPHTAATDNSPTCKGCAIAMTVHRDPAGNVQYVTYSRQDVTNHGLYLVGQFKYVMELLLPTDLTPTPVTVAAGAYPGLGGEGVQSYALGGPYGSAGPSGAAEAAYLAATQDAGPYGLAPGTATTSPSGPGMTTLPTSANPQACPVPAGCDFPAAWVSYYTPQMPMTAVEYLAIAMIQSMPHPTFGWAIRRLDDPNATSRAMRDMNIRLRIVELIDTPGALTAAGQPCTDWRYVTPDGVHFRVQNFDGRRVRVEISHSFLRGETCIPRCTWGLPEIYGTAEEPASAVCNCGRYQTPAWGP